MDADHDGIHGSGETRGETTVSGWDPTGPTNGKRESGEADPLDDDTDAKVDRINHLVETGKMNPEMDERLIA